MQEISFIPIRDLMFWIVWNANIFVEKNKIKIFIEHFYSCVHDIQGMIIHIDIHPYSTERPNYPKTV